MTHTILLVEDNPHIIKVNRGMLEKAGYRVLCAETIAGAQALLEKESPHLLVLDIMLPDGDGRAFCRELRETQGIHVPVLFLTALGCAPDMEAGYAAGGTDYLVKPFDLHHLVLKVTALIRHHDMAARAGTELSLGSLRLDALSRRATADGEDLLLKGKEAALLELLMLHQGQYITTSEIYERLWNMAPEGDARTVKEHVSRLRRKLRGRAPVSIESARGKGYRLVERLP